MRLKVNPKSAAMYFLYAVAAALANLTVKNVPLGLGLYFAMMACGANAVLTPVLYILSTATHLNLAMSAVCACGALFLCAVVMLYRRSRRKMKAEAAIYLIIVLAPYVVFAPGEGMADLIGNAYATKAIAAAGVTVFTFFAYKSAYAAIFRLFRCRLKDDEVISLCVVAAICGAGLYNLAGSYIYAALCTGAVIFSVRLARSPAAFSAALAIAAAPCALTLDLQPVTACVILTAACLAVKNAGRFAVFFAGGGLAALYLYFTGGYNCAIPLIVFRALFLLCAALLPSLPPDKPYARLKDKLLVREKLGDERVDRAKRRTGEKIYRISEVFREIECAFNSLDEQPDEELTRERIFAELCDKCCKPCERRKKCETSGVYQGFKMLIASGCLKGKVNLIDLPAEITGNCCNPAEVMGRLNAILTEYRRCMTEAENARSGRILLADQAHGVASALKNCAVELCRRSENSAAAEDEITKRLAVRGISCPELSVESGEVSAVLCGKPDVNGVAKVISEALGREYALCDRIDYDDDKRCMIFRAPPAYDAAFGAAYAVKDGEKVSGDTHSVIKINEHSFLMALSDGMGSGEYARKVSATAISLIEAFYRAEMPEGTVMKTINKLLSFNRDERFACIDLAAINLESGSAEFVKIGSPAGIIMRRGEIKVLESESLPLGILENLRPAVSREKLNDGDIVVFMSDGVTSAFSSSTELYSFLQGERPLNPQNLADKILAQALACKNGEAEDDMTVLCTRIYKR